jgi:Xaa-Pro aminopeptidase
VIESPAPRRPDVHAPIPLLQARFERLRAGVDARRVPLAAEEVMFDHFPAARDGDQRRFQVSHFIGADYAEYPSAITAAVPSLGRFFPSPEPRLVEFPLEVGMTMELHPNVCPPGLGFGSVGDVFRVGEHGAERLTSYPVEMRIVEPR